MKLDLLQQVEPVAIRQAEVNYHEIPRCRLAGLAEPLARLPTVRHDLRLKAKVTSQLRKQ